MSKPKLEFPQMPTQKASDIKIDKKPSPLAEAAEEITAIEKPLQESDFKIADKTTTGVSKNEYTARALKNSTKKYFNVLDFAAVLRGNKKIT